MQSCMAYFARMRNAAQFCGWGTVLLPGKQVRALREYDQKSGWRQLVPPAKAREPYDNEVFKRWTAEITKTTVTQRDLSLTGRCDPYV
jgi:hypothetical protein